MSRSFSRRTEFLHSLVMILLRTILFLEYQQFVQLRAYLERCFILRLQVDARMRYGQTHLGVRVGIWIMENKTKSLEGVQTSKILGGGVLFVQ